MRGMDMPTLSKFLNYWADENECRGSHILIDSEMADTEVIIGSIFAKCGYSLSELSNLLKRAKNLHGRYWYFDAAVDDLETFDEVGDVLEYIDVENYVPMFEGMDYETIFNID